MVVSKIRWEILAALRLGVRFLPEERLQVKRVFIVAVHYTLGQWK